VKETELKGIMLIPYQLEILVCLVARSAGSLANTRSAPSSGRVFLQEKEVCNSLSP
jgi:hypothetical protein